LPNHVACLDEPADRRALWDAIDDVGPWFVERRVKGREAPARVVRRQGQLVTQTQIERPSRRHLPVILEEEVVIGGAQAGFADAGAEDRTKNGAGQKIRETLEIDPASAVLIIAKVVLVVDDLGARADAMLASRDREGISNRRRRHGDPRI